MSTARAFLNGIIDYAGLFPPARLRMDDAVREYARYRRSADRDLLGRFILPASTLDEFSAAAKPFLSDDDAEVWRLSAIASARNDSDLEDINDFNREHSGVVVDAIEMPVHSDDDIDWAAERYSDSFLLYLEPALVGESPALLHSIAKTGVSAKLRTGGIVPTAIPSATAVLGFIDTCDALALPFKATAGLHHAIRGEYPLTYETHAQRGMMYGYLNVFLAAAFHRAGLPASALLDLLEETDSASITFDAGGVSWRGNVADAEQLLETRRSLAVSFGSCSFTEPVDEARQLHLI